MEFSVGGRLSLLFEIDQTIVGSLAAMPDSA